MKRKENDVTTSITTLIAKANKCLIDNSPNKPTFNPDTFLALVGEDNFIDFGACCAADPPEVQMYRGRFYSVDYRKISYGDEGRLIAIMKDERGNVHSILSDGKAIWSKEPGWTLIKDEGESDE
jgi:hypothetical protein